jgi:hypothetical protein
MDSERDLPDELPFYVGEIIGTGAFATCVSPSLLVL